MILDKLGILCCFMCTGGSTPYTEEELREQQRELREARRSKVQFARHNMITSMRATPMQQHAQIICSVHRIVAPGMPPVPPRPVFPEAVPVAEAVAPDAVAVSSEILQVARPI